MPGIPGFPFVPGFPGRPRGPVSPGTSSTRISESNSYRLLSVLRPEEIVSSDSSQMIESGFSSEIYKQLENYESGIVNPYNIYSGTFYRTSYVPSGGRFGPFSHEVAAEIRACSRTDKPTA
jgi:hypothetical protein